MTCESGQGYYFAKPLAVEDVSKLFSKDGILIEPDSSKLELVAA